MSESRQGRFPDFPDPRWRFLERAFLPATCRGPDLGYLVGTPVLFASVWCRSWVIARVIGHERDAMARFEALKRLFSRLFGLFGWYQANSCRGVLCAGWHIGAGFQLVADRAGVRRGR